MSSLDKDGSIKTRSAQSARQQAETHVARPVRDMSGVCEDMQDFLADYPHQAASDSLLNLHFYQNLVRMQPDNINICTALKALRGAYAELEDNHGYIQWLFPIRARGVNASARPLTLQERTALRASPELQYRFKNALCLMLDFYGFRIHDEFKGEMVRTAEFRGRYENLLSRRHNYLRITRILKSTAEFGLERQYSVPILLWFLLEQSRGELNSDLLVQSMDEYWIHCLRHTPSREFIGRLTAQVRQGHSLTEEEYLAILKQKRRTGVWRCLDDAGFKAS